MPASRPVVAQELSAALDAGRRRLVALSRDLLEHEPVLSDRETGALLLAWVDQAADTLTAVADAFEERRMAVHGASATGTAPAPAVDIERR